MFKKKNLIYRVKLLIPLFLFYGINLQSADKILETEHFKIIHQPKYINQALLISSKLELIHVRISEFLEFDPLWKINVFFVDEIAGDGNKIEISESTDKNIFLFPDVDSNYIQNLIDKKLFFIYFNSLFINGSVDSQFEIFSESFYTYYKSSPFILKMLKADLATSYINQSLDPAKIHQYSSDNQKEIYILLIDFIISVYGKKNFLQIVRDINYYNGFINALIKISGESYQQAFNSFNDYIKTISSLQIENLKKRNIFSNDKNFHEELSCAFSGSNVIAILQKYKEQYSVLLSKNNHITTKYLNLENDVLYISNLIFVSDNSLALTGITGKGSRLYLYNLNENKLMKIKFFSQLFISNINRYNENEIIFAAFCGTTSNIYTYNIIKDDFDILIYGDNNFSPVMFNDKVYYISFSDKYKLNIFDTRTGYINTILQNSEEMSDLNIYNNNIFFLLKSENNTDVFNINTESMKTEKIFSADFFLHSPFIINNNLYFFSLNKTKRKLFYTSFEPLH